MGIGRQTFKHTAIYSMATIFGRLASFLMLPFYAHIFQAQGYGVIAMIDTSLGFLAIIMSSSFQTSILRIYHEQNQENKNVTLRTGITLAWLLGIFIIFLPFIFSPLLSKIILGNSEYYLLICLALGSLVLDVTGQSASTVQIIKQQSILFSIINLGSLILGLLLNIWLVIFLEAGLIGVFLSSLITAFISSLIFHCLAFYEHGFGFNVEIATHLVKFQLPLLPGEIISFLGRQAERVLVRILVGLEGMGILEMAYKFPPLLNLLVTIPFQRAWRTKSIEIADQENAPKIISEMFTRYFFIIVFLGLMLGVTIQSIIELTTPPEFWQAISIAKIEIITTILNGSITYLSFGILYSKKTKILSLIKMVLAPIKILVSFLFIFSWGLKGAAYSALMMEFIALIWIFNKAQTLYPMPFDYWKIGLISFSGFIIFLLLGTDNQLHKSVVLYASEKLLYPFMIFLEPILENWNLAKLYLILQNKKDNIILLLSNIFLSSAFLGLIPFVWGPVLAPSSVKT